ncbi:hypothetical protein SESBI_39782 [Sesbania bispinosa]|nr:hypothetical protein SESBI_39782 [Sesbania bispinosa]
MAYGESNKDGTDARSDYDAIGGDMMLDQDMAHGERNNDGPDARRDYLDSLSQSIVGVDMVGRGGGELDSSNHTTELINDVGQGSGKVQLCGVGQGVREVHRRDVGQGDGGGETYIVNPIPELPKRDVGRGIRDIQRRDVGQDVGEVHGCDVGLGAGGVSGQNEHGSGKSKGAGGNRYVQYVENEVPEYTQHEVGQQQVLFGHKGSSEELFGKVEREMILEDNHAT